MALFDKMLGKDNREEKLRQEIKSLELRKESIIASINGEIGNLQAEQRTVFLEAGKNAYDIWRKDKLQANLTAYFEKVQELESKIAAQEAKKKEMTDRYDEEIKLIANNIDFGSMNAGKAAVVTGSASCPNCGSAIANDDAFCQNCGTKLQ